LTKIKTKKYFN